MLTENMVNFLKDMAQKLKSDNFGADDQAAMQLARNHASNTIIPTAFALWLERCPEAIAFCAGFTFSRPLSDEAMKEALLAPPPPPEPGLGVVRVGDNGIWMEYTVLGEVAGMLKVQALGDKVLIRAVQLDKIHPEDREAVSRILRELRGFTGVDVDPPEE